MTVDVAGGPGAPQEVELKYAVQDVAALHAWLDGPDALPGVTLGAWTARADTDTYVDTDDRALAEAGYGGRLRERGSRITLTLKTLRSVPEPEVSDTADDGDGASSVSVALHRRIELEGPATPSGDPLAWPDSPARALLLELIGDAPLRIRFVIAQRRAVRQLRDETGQVAELSLDESTVRYRDLLAGSFATLEIEARGRAETLLAHVAAAVEATGLVIPEPRSKEAIAEAMVDAQLWNAAAPPADGTSGTDGTGETAQPDLDTAEEDVAAAADLGEDGVAPPDEGAVDAATAGVTPRPVVARPIRFPGVRADDTLGSAGRKVLRMHLARMLASEDGTRSGMDAEDVHKMRVATRRMRAAWRVFNGAYRARPQRRYVRELRVVATALGAVRDLDVQLLGLRDYVAALPRPGQRAMEPLVNAWTERREAGRQDLIALLDSGRYAGFADDYQEFVDTPEAGELDPVPGSPTFVRDRAAGRIWQAYECLRAHDTSLAWADVPALHALRIDAKRLRYTLEFFKEVLPPGVDLLIARVTELQDHLGLLNDADVAAHMTRDYLATHASRLPAASREAIGFYLASREAEIARLRRLVPPIWRRLLGSQFRRTLAFTVAAL